MRFVQKLILCLSVILLLGHMYPEKGLQKKINIAQEDLHFFHKRVSKVFKKSACYSKQQLKFIDIIYCSRSDSFALQDLYNKDSLLTLKPLKYNPKCGKPFLSSESYVCDSKANLLGYGTGLQFYCARKDSPLMPSYQTMVNKIIELKLDPIIALSSAPLLTYFGFNENGEVYVIDVKQDLVITKTLKEYLETQ